MNNDSINTLSMPEVNVSPVPSTKWEREFEAFRCLLPSLLSTYRGQFVAVHEGRVVDSGEDRLALIFRVLGKVGNVDIHVGLVTDQVETAVRITHYRIIGER